MTAAFQAGQQVRLTRGDEALNATVKQVIPTSIQYVETDSGIPDMAIEWWRSRGWSIAVVDPPTPEPQPLPTVPGTVIRWEKQHYTALAILEKPNQWLFEDRNYMNDAMLMQIDGAPFTALGSLKDHTEAIAKHLTSGVIVDGPFTAARRVREFGEASE